jgi:cytochrome c peroxidase
MKQSLFATLLGGFFLLVACQKKEEDKIYRYQSLNLPKQVDNYKSEFDAVFTSPFGNTNLNVPEDNPITNMGATLGRVLFYDKLLSENNTIACVSCHQQEASFSDKGKALSIGFEGNSTSRNSMSIVNTADNGFYFWDGRTATLEALALQPVRNHIEMGLDKIPNLEKKLEQTPYYTELFEKAFGSKEITRDKISKALSQFVHSLVSKTSKFDAGLKNNFSNYTASEKRGEELFLKELYCGQCHNGPDLDSRGGSFGWGNNDLNLNRSSANIGLSKEYKDPGVGGLFSGTEAIIANGIFKVPSLRNVALTAPYMHDGRFKTLEEVIDHYSNGVEDHPNLDSRIRFFNQTTGWNGGGTDTTQNRHLKLNLTPQQKADLVAFLHTLTDNKFIQDKKFSSPFGN